MTLETLVDALRHTELSDRDAVRLLIAALESGDFDVAPDFTTRPSHLRLIYDPPASFRVVDVVMLTEKRAQQ
ncbi:hypothetical protein [Bradyrhizobium zhanjiangense]|uniref:hypothetical protein n=1 Tax=Bradyrhizobium zhanjiangense TaxID=1325107 RepID=UPI00100918B7|nr:hypothetical protein [Bradyrhizobium zhanjiangense]